MYEMCPLCLKSGVRSKIRSFQLNLKEAVWLCESNDCSWPFGFKDLDIFKREVGKKWSYHWKDFKIAENKSKEALPQELFLYNTPPDTPVTDLVCKDTLPDLSTSEVTVISENNISSAKNIHSSNAVNIFLDHNYARNFRSEQESSCNLTNPGKEDETPYSVQSDCNSISSCENTEELDIEVITLWDSNSECSDNNTTRRNKSEKNCNLKRVFEEVEDNLFKKLLPIKVSPEKRVAEEAKLLKIRRKHTLNSLNGNGINPLISRHLVTVKGSDDVRSQSNSKQFNKFCFETTMAQDVVTSEKTLTPEKNNSLVNKPEKEDLFEDLDFEMNSMDKDDLSVLENGKIDTSGSNTNNSCQLSLESLLNDIPVGNHDFGQDIDADWIESLFT